MEPRWLFALYSIVLLATSSRAASVSTKDTDVVAGESEQSEATAEGPLLPIQVTEMLINSDVSLRYAHTSIVSRVRNPAHRAQETTYHVLLPETAFITGNNKTYPAYVARKREADKTYSDAVVEGTPAAHILSARDRDSNHFTVTVNVEPNSEALLKLTYEELLVRRNGVYSHAINVLPEGFVPKFIVTVKIKEPQNITILTVPKEKTENDDDDNAFKKYVSEQIIELKRPQLVGIKLSNDRKEADVIFTPDREEQIRLMQIYADKAKEVASASDHWYLHQNDNEYSTETPGQFVVQYDVARPEKKEILVNDGYFAFYVAPANLTKLSNYVIFVVDTSGGRIDYQQDVMRTILNDLRPTDYFNIIDFHSNVKVLNISEYLEYPGERDYSIYRRDDVSALPPPTPATAENIERAQSIVSKFDQYGGADIYDALDVAVDLVNKKFGKKSDSADDERSESDINTDDLQPIIIMITTGRVTAGIDEDDRIIVDITRKNSERRAPIHTIAYGKDTNVNLLRKISLINNGFMRRIYPNTDSALQVMNYYQEIASLLRSKVTFTYPRDQLRVKYKIFEDYSYREKREYQPLERFWAYTTIMKLLEDLKTYEFTDKELEFTPERRAYELALQTELVTPLTSLVVVKTTEKEPPKNNYGPYVTIRDCTCSPGPSYPQAQFNSAEGRSGI